VGLDGLSQGMGTAQEILSAQNDGLPFAGCSLFIG
jgi:hypothetical protein